MKVLQINTVFPYGSTGKIVKSIDNYLTSKGVDSVIVYGTGSKSINNSYRVCCKNYIRLQALVSRITGLMYGGCLISTHFIKHLVLKEAPDVVHLHCLNGHFVNIYNLISWLKQNKICTILTLHAEFLHTGNCGYALDCERWKTGCGKCPRLKQETKSWFLDRTKESWERMKEAFDGFNSAIVVSVSPWLEKRVAQAPILSSIRQRVIINGLDESIFHRYNVTHLREELGIHRKKAILHVTSHFSTEPSDIKGGYYLPIIARELKECVFLVVGPCFSSVTVPDNVVLIGRINDQKRMAELYSLADLTILLSKKETFSMVVAESLCCGTPVVGFKAGAPEMIAIDEYCQFVDQGDLVSLKQAMLLSLLSKWDNDSISKAAIEKYSESKMNVEYMSLYNEMICSSANQNKLL